MKSVKAKIFTILIIFTFIYYFNFNNFNQTARKITGQIGISNLNKINIINLKTPFKNKNGIRIFCIVLTQSASLDFKAPVTYEAWLNKCDDYRFLTLLPSDLTNIIKEDPNEVKYKYNLSNSAQAVPYFKQYKQKYEYIKLLKPPGLVKDVYDKITDKIYLGYKYIFKNYGSYDWYLKCDDDTFVYYENLLRFLKDKNKTEAVSYGRLVGEYANGFLSGGGGYVMSQESFKRLASQLIRNESFCPNSGAEDVDVSQCLHKLKSRIGKSTDDSNKCRFHSNHLFKVYPSEYVNIKLLV
jgi:hypothetical protein